MRTQDKTGIAWNPWEYLRLLDRPSTNIGHGLITNWGLLGSSRNGPSRLRNLLLELLDEWGFDAGGLDWSVDCHGKAHEY